MLQKGGLPSEIALPGGIFEYRIVYRGVAQKHFSLLYREKGTVVTENEGHMFRVAKYLAHYSTITWFSSRRQTVISTVLDSDCLQSTLLSTADCESRNTMILRPAWQKGNRYMSPRTIALNQGFGSICQLNIISDNKSSSVYPSYILSATYCLLMLNPCLVINQKHHPSAVWLTNYLNT